MGWILTYVGIGIVIAATNNFKDFKEPRYEIKSKKTKRKSNPSSKSK